MGPKNIKCLCPSPHQNPGSMFAWIPRAMQWIQTSLWEHVDLSSFPCSELHTELLNFPQHRHRRHSWARGKCDLMPLCIMLTCGEFWASVHAAFPGNSLGKGHCNDLPTFPFRKFLGFCSFLLTLYIPNLENPRTINTQVQKGTILHNTMSRSFSTASQTPVKLLLLSPLHQTLQPGFILPLWTRHYPADTNRCADSWFVRSLDEGDPGSNSYPWLFFRYFWWKLQDFPNCSSLPANGEINRFTQFAEKTQRISFSGCTSWKLERCFW